MTKQNRTPSNTQFQLSVRECFLFYKQNNFVKLKLITFHMQTISNVVQHKAFEGPSFGATTLQKKALFLDGGYKRRCDVETACSNPSIPSTPFGGKSTKYPNIIK